MPMPQFCLRIDAPSSTCQSTLIDVLSHLDRRVDKNSSTRGWFCVAAKCNYFSCFDYVREPLPLGVSCWLWVISECVVRCWFLKPQKLGKIFQLYATRWCDFFSRRQKLIGYIMKKVYIFTYKVVVLFGHCGNACKHYIHIIPDERCAQRPKQAEQSNETIEAEGCICQKKRAWHVLLMARNYQTSAMNFVISCISKPRCNANLIIFTLDS